jgi:hypothetical protein
LWNDCCLTVAHIPKFTFTFLHSFILLHIFVYASMLLAVWTNKKPATVGQPSTAMI